MRKMHNVYCTTNLNLRRTGTLKKRDTYIDFGVDFFLC